MRVYSALSCESEVWIRNHHPLPPLNLRFRSMFTIKKKNDKGHTGLIVPGVGLTFVCVIRVTNLKR